MPIIFCPRFYHKQICMQIALLPRNPHGHGWLRPAIGVVELSQNIIQVLFLFLFKISTL